MDGSTKRQYQMESLLGRGGFGEVYRASLVSAGGFRKTVAVKLIHEDLPHQEALLRLRDEARVLGLLHHRAIVAVDGLVKLEGRWAIVMEHVPGYDISHLLAHAGTFPPDVCMYIGAEIASGLIAAYETIGPDQTPLHLLHRDIKPSNIRITPHGDIKLLDFGIARADFDREAKTQRYVFGSGPYMAPERLAMVESTAGDVFSLSVTLTNMLIGDIGDNPAATPTQHAERLAPLKSKLMAIHPKIAQIVSEGFEYGSEDRPSTTEFQRRCREVACDSERLRQWVKEVFPNIPPPPPQAKANATLTGTTLTEDAEEDNTTSAFYLSSEAIELPPPAPPQGKVSFASPPPPPPLLDEPSLKKSEIVARPIAPPPKESSPRSPIATFALVSALGSGAAGVTLFTLTAILFSAFLLLFLALLAMVWPEVMVEQCLDDVNELKSAYVLATDPESKKILRDAGGQMQRACNRQQLGLMSQIQISIRLDDIKADSKITESEARNLRQVIRRQINE